MQSLITDPPATGRATGAARAHRLRTAVVGTALVAVPVLLIVGVLEYGSTRRPGGTGPVAAVAAGVDPYARLLVTLPVVLAACLLAGRLARRLGQPPVIGEIVAGIVLGPSVLGLVSPGVSGWLFRPDVVAVLNILAQLGLIFFMYLIGTEIDFAAIRGRNVTAMAVSHVSVALPMLTGVVLAFTLYPTYGAGVGFLPFALFFGVSISITAFPVLARILTDRGISATPLGVFALTCAAIIDVAAWCLLAVVTAIIHGGSGAGAVVTIALTGLFTVAMVYGVRPALAWIMHRVSDMAALPIVLAGIMLSALATNQIGIHPIFGAFLFGVIAPRSAPSATRAADKMTSLTVTLLLPLFFVQTGLHTRFGLLGGDARAWAWCAAITAVAVAAKWAGGAVTARLTGLGWRPALAIGALLNCRGLTELVVLGIGRQLNVISPTVFAMLVIMTLVSTVATGPALSAIDRWRRGRGGPPTTDMPAANDVRSASDPRPASDREPASDPRGEPEADLVLAGHHPDPNRPRGME